MKGASAFSPRQSGRPQASRAATHRLARPTTRRAATQAASTVNTASGAPASSASARNSSVSRGAPTVTHAMGPMRPWPSHRPVRLGVTRASGNPHASSQSKAYAPPPRCDTASNTRPSTMPSAAHASTVAATSPAGVWPWCEMRRAIAIPKPEQTASNTDSTAVNSANTPCCSAPSRAVTSVMPRPRASAAVRASRLISAPRATPLIGCALWCSPAVLTCSAHLRYSNPTLTW